MKKLLLISFIILMSIPMTSHGQYYYNRAFNLTGTVGDYVVTGPGTELSITGNFTLECWLKPTNSTTPIYQNVLSKKLSGSTGYELYLNNGKATLRTNGATRLVGKTVLPNNVWTHVAGTYTSSTNTFIVYLNGVLDTTLTIATGAPTANTDSLYFGKGTNSPYIGLLDEVRVWNITRSASDISSTMRMPLGEGTGVYTGLVGVWRANSISSGSGTEEINGYTAYLRGTASYADLTNRNNSHLAFNTGLVCTGGAADTYVGIPNSSAISPTTAITLECWILTDNTAVQVIIGKGTSGTGYPFRLLKSTANTFRVLLNSGNLIGTGNYGGIIPLNIWTHLAFTYNSTTGAYAYYMNGVQTQTGTQSIGAIATNSEPMTMGGGPSQVTLVGMLDEVRIANYAKTPLEIQQQMFTSIDQNNEPNSGNTNVAYNFEGTLADYTDGANRGTFVGAGTVRFSQVYNNAAEFPTPLDRWDAGKFGAGFREKYSGLNFGAAPTTVTDSIYMGQVLSISDINLFVAANHTYAGDISISLKNPAGTTTRVLYPGNSANVGMHMVTIFDDEADSTIGGTVLAPFSPRVKPVNSLNTFNGQAAFGWWKIIITDIFPSSDNGVLLGWGIQFNNQLITGMGGVANEIPGKFDLQQNYPNPFNPVTTINYEVAKNSDVKLVIFDMLGREITTLVNERKTQGAYSILFDGSKLSSGSYFYRLTAGDYVNTKKMILVK